MNSICFPKENAQMANRYKKGAQLVIRKMQIKTMMKYHFTPVRIPVI